MSMQTGKPTTFCFAASQSACKLSPATFPFLLCFLCLYSVCAVKVAFLEVHLNVSSAQAPHRFASETRSLRPSQDRLKLLCIELSDSNFFFVSFSLDLMSCAAAAFSSLQGCHHPHFAYAFKPSPQALPTSPPHKPSPQAIPTVHMLSQLMLAELLQHFNGSHKECSCNAYLNKGFLP